MEGVEKNRSYTTLQVGIARNPEDTIAVAIHLVEAGLALVTVREYGHKSFILMDTLKELSEYLKGFRGKGLIWRDTSDHSFTVSQVASHALSSEKQTATTPDGTYAYA